ANQQANSLKKSAFHDESRHPLRGATSPAAEIWAANHYPIIGLKGFIVTTKISGLIGTDFQRGNREGAQRGGCVARGCGGVKTRWRCGEVPAACGVSGAGRTERAIAGVPTAAGGRG